MQAAFSIHLVLVFISIPLIIIIEALAQILLSKYFKDKVA